MTDFYDAGGYSDERRIARSKPILAPLAAGTYGVIRLPKHAFIHDVYVDIIDACETDGEMAVTVGLRGNGEAADDDALLVNAAIVPGITGMARSIFAVDSFGGKRFSTANGAVTLTIGADSALTAGKLQVFCEYSIIHG